jgi:hypothetical protein
MLQLCVLITGNPGRPRSPGKPGNPKFLHCIKLKKNRQY